jgi:hypothetical protein
LENILVEYKQCIHCGGSKVSRSQRRGFLEKNVFSFFGYYPWRCAQCKNRSLQKDRGDWRHNRMEKRTYVDYQSEATAARPQDVVETTFKISA